MVANAWVAITEKMGLKDKAIVCYHENRVCNGKLECVVRKGPGVCTEYRMGGFSMTDECINTTPATEDMSSELSSATTKNTPSRGDVITPSETTNVGAAVTKNPSSTGGAATASPNVGAATTENLSSTGGVTVSSETPTMDATTTENLSSTGGVTVSSETPTMDAGSDETCLPGWTTYESQCYRYFEPMGRDFDASEAYCRGIKGGHLLKIENGNNGLSLAFPRLETPVRIGYRRVDNTWMWTDGTVGGYEPHSDWDDGEENKDCAVIIREHNLTWRNHDCSSHYSFICEYTRAS